MPPRSVSLAPGQRFHGLVVHSMLGEGAMGAAYLASHPILRTPLVLKLFKVAAGDDLFQEAHLAARVRSANAVGAIDAGVEDDVPFLVQPYVDGVDLGELLRAAQAMGRPLPMAVVCRALVDAARGLHAVHQCGVVHRDIKPENLFLRGDGITTVGDFGIAVDPQRVAQDGAPIAGTPQFMAPEMWCGQTPARESDLYSLGATAHLLATGRVPFDAATAIDLGMKHVQEPYVPPPAGTPRDAYFWAIVAALLRKFPDERYPSADAVAHDLALIAEPPPRWLRLGDAVAQVGAVRVQLFQGDLAAHEADVLVNAANGALSMRLGVANALREAGGDVIEAEAFAHAPVAMGSVVWTSPGRLRARHVAHAVAAVEGAVCLQRAALRALLGAEVRGARKIAFPALGAGVGQVPMAMGASLLLEVVRTFASLEPRHLTAIDFVLFDAPTLAIWKSILRSM